MSDDKNEEVQAAEALRRALEGDGPDLGDEEGEIFEIAQRIQATAGRAAPLDPGVKAAALDAAIRKAAEDRAPERKERVAARPARRWLRWGAAALAAAVALFALGAVMMLARYGSGMWSGMAGMTAELPMEIYSAPTDDVFDEPFPEGQSPAERMDQIVAARTRGYFSALAARRGAVTVSDDSTPTPRARVASTEGWSP